MNRSPIEGLVCPELNLSLFCRRVKDRDISGVLDAAGMESSLLHRDYRDRTRRSTFRPGTKQRRYVDDLQSLVFMLLNGQYPHGCDDRFFLSVAPLVTALLVKWNFGNLKEVFSEQALDQHLYRESERSPLLRTILRAREDGNGAAAGMVNGRGNLVRHDVLGHAAIHLAVRSNSKIATELLDLSASNPFLLRVDRGFSSGIVLTIHHMPRAAEVDLQRAANAAALKVLQHELGIDGYVMDWEND